MMYRQRDSVENPVKVMFYLSSKQNGRLTEFAKRAGVSRSAYIDWLLRSEQVNPDGRPARWAAEHPAEDNPQDALITEERAAA